MLEDRLCGGVFFPFVVPGKGRETGKEKGRNGEVKKHDGNRCELLVVVDFLTGINMVDCWEAFVWSCISQSEPWEG